MARKSAKPGLPDRTGQRMELNGMVFTPIPGVDYLHDYIGLALDVEQGKAGSKETWRTVLRTDLWAMVYFGLGVAPAHHPFVVAAANEVQLGPESGTLDVWAREHFKSTIITVGRNIQRLMIDPERRIAIFSYTRDAARIFYRTIKQNFENNAFLREMFDDIIPDGKGETPQWSDDGLILKRKSVQKECSIEPWGLIEGMPTGRHFTDMTYDDIMVEGLSRNPAVMESVKDKFDMSLFVGSNDCRINVVGTFYKEDDPLVYIQNKKDGRGRPMFKTRLKPGTEDGKFNGKPVLLTEERNEQLKSNRAHYSTQILCQPTPEEERKLRWERVNRCGLGDVPKGLYRFLMVDPAGEPGDPKRGDSWAIMLLGVEPKVQDNGLWRVWLLDAFLEKCTHPEGVAKVVELYMRGGFIRQLAIEKVSQSTAEIHISNALRAKGRSVTIANKLMRTVAHQGRAKVQRIKENLVPIVDAGFFSVVDSVPEGVIQRLEAEFRMFPNAKHDDGSDALAYAPDVLKEFPFPRIVKEEQVQEARRDKWDRAFDREAKKHKISSLSWMKG